MNLAVTSPDGSATKERQRATCAEAMDIKPGSKDATVRFNPPMPARSAVGALLVRCGAMLRAAFVEVRHRRTERALASLSDATLKDIGLHRSEIRSVTRFPEGRRDRATVHLARTAKD